MSVLLWVTIDIGQGNVIGSENSCFDKNSPNSENIIFLKIRRDTLKKIKIFAFCHWDDRMILLIISASAKYHICGFSLLNHPFIPEVNPAWPQFYDAFKMLQHLGLWRFLSIIGFLALVPQ